MIAIRRSYHVSYTVFSIKKQALKLNKMINPKPKRQWFSRNDGMDTNIMPSAKSLSRTKYVPGKQATRRIAMLNKVFMKHITDLMSTGTVAMDVLGRGIEISKVRITPDFHTVNVYWVCKGTSTDIETEVILKRIAGCLRHELSTLRVMGEIPHIAFVKDKQESRVVELDRILSGLDYGDDYQPTDMGHLLKTEFTLNTKLSPEMKAKIKQLEEESPFEEDPIPEMTHNIYGLDHAKILNRLMAARKKTRDAWVNVDAENSVITYRAPGHKADPESIDERKELADFLLKRQILHTKMLKNLRSLREEWQHTHQLDDDHKEDADYEYLEEDEEEDDFFYDEAENSIENRDDKLS